jgi:hypothetical protein
MLPKMKFEFSPTLNGEQRGFVLTAIENIIGIVELGEIDGGKKYLNASKPVVYTMDEGDNQTLVIDDGNGEHIYWEINKFLSEDKVLKVVSIATDAGKIFSKLRRSEMYRLEAKKKNFADNAWLAAQLPKTVIEI